MGWYQFVVIIMAVLAIGFAWLWSAVRRGPKAMKGGRMMVAEYRDRASEIEKFAETDISKHHRQRLRDMARMLRERADYREGELRNQSARTR